LFLLSFFLGLLERALNGWKKVIPERKEKHKASQQLHRSTLVKNVLTKLKRIHQESSEKRQLRLEEFSRETVS
jgi:hypothetical protein